MSHKKFFLFTFLASIGVWCGCIKISQPYTAIPPGIWRATLELSIDSADIAEERSEGMLPFNFEVKYVTADSFIIEFINGEERILCTDIDFGKNRQIGKDTIRIEIPPFGTYITGKYEEDAIEGFWWDPSRGAQYRISFRARHGKAHRFQLTADAGHENFDGRWKALIGVDTESPEETVLLVRQDKNDAEGTILTETGDYRYLDGNVENDRLFFSTFDGSHAYLFEAKLQADGSLSGVYRSGNHYKTYWTATRNDTFALSDPYALTTLNDQVSVQFHLPNLNGDTISLDDAGYAGKAKVINIFGTWCPNCMDEMHFLTSYFKENPSKDISVISLAYERHADRQKALEALRKYRDHYDIPWEILYGGSSKKEEVTRSLPFLEKFIAFPTMIFLDRENHVVKIHTGFSGPATEGYEAFRKDFHETMKSLTTATGLEQ